MRTLLVRLKCAISGRSVAGAGALFSLIAGLACYVVSERWIERDARLRFAGHATNARGNLENRIKSYSDLLRGVGSTLRTNTTMTARSFREYVSGLKLDQQFPAVQFISYAEYTLERDLPSLERRLTAQYGAPPPERGMWLNTSWRKAEYDIITLAQPGPMPNASIGYDLRSDPERVALVEHSRGNDVISHSGQPVGKIGLPNDPVFGFRAPLYRVGMPTSNREQRRAAYLGSVGILFSTKALVEGVLADLPVRNVRMRLVDVSPGYQSAALPRVPGGRLIFDSSAAAAAPGADADRVFSTTEVIPFYNRRWSATFSVPKRVFYTGSEVYFPKLAAGAGAITALLLYALFAAMSSSRHRALALAHAMTLDLRRLAARANQVKEGERQRIAREIHDELGQNLLALRIEADVLTERTRQRHPRLHARAAQTRDQIDTTIKSVRQIINDLRPAVLDLGLAAALEWQVAEFTRRSGIPCHLVGHTGIELDDQHATAFFRILQESLSNVLRHASASAVDVEVRSTPGVLAMTITDNGIGMAGDAGTRHGSFGLLGIEERVTMLGGTFSFDGAPGKGTTIRVSIPVGGGAQASPAPSVSQGAIAAPEHGRISCRVNQAMSGKA
jgi:signal transduction histidine kinase